MNLFTNILVLLAALLAVFWESAFHGIRHLIGVQVDLLPALIVYASLYGSFMTLCLLALVGGLGFDSLSANPLGTSVLPLFFCGLGIYASRDLILRDQIFAQLVLGFLASLLAPVLSLVYLLTTGHEPLFGWGTIWQLMVMSIGGALATPVCFEIFALLHRALGAKGPTQSSFRPDREIRRGRS
jgi:cell shape-determining protein MreD